MKHNKQNQDMCEHSRNLQKYCEVFDFLKACKTEDQPFNLDSKGRVDPGKIVNILIRDISFCKLNK